MNEWSDLIGLSEEVALRVTWTNLWYVLLLLIRALGLPQSIEWLKARQEIQARLYWGPCCSSREWKQVTSSLACKEPGSWFLILGEGRGVSRGWGGGVAQGVCPPLWWCWVQGACTVPCFCSGLCRSGSWGFFGLFVSCCPEFALIKHTHSYF